MLLTFWAFCPLGFSFELCFETGLCLRQDIGECQCPFIRLFMHVKQSMVIWVIHETESIFIYFTHDSHLAEKSYWLCQHYKHTFSQKHLVLRIWHLLVILTWNLSLIKLISDKGSITLWMHQDLYLVWNDSVKIWWKVRCLLDKTRYLIMIQSNEIFWNHHLTTFYLLLTVNSHLLIYGVVNLLFTRLFW